MLRDQFGNNLTTISEAAGEAKRLLEMRRPLATNLIALSGVGRAI